MAKIGPTRGEIWWYEEPDRKARPVRILTRDEAIGSLHRLVAVPTTSTVRDIPTHVQLDESDGMPDSCALALDNTLSADKAFLTHRVTRLGPAKTDEVCRALNLALSCSNHTGA
jgi:mRNA interferase MazF